MCWLGVFLLPAFTRLGYECQDLLSPCDGMHVHKPDFGLYSHSKEFGGNGARAHVHSKGKFPFTRGSEEIQTRKAVSHGAASPTHFQLSYTGPQSGVQDVRNVATMWMLFCL